MPTAVSRLSWHRAPTSGNWLPTGGIDRYMLVLRLYDTAVGVPTKASREVPMPTITTRSCP